MHVIKATNAGLMWAQALDYVQREGCWQETRAGRALVVDQPVALVYNRPWQRVLLDPVRDANPFFHLFESLWMLAGRDDAKWLDQFVSDFSSRFAEEDGHQHGAYGRRWRNWWPVQTIPECGPKDQLDVVVNLLKNNKQDRQAIIQMWDPQADLGVPNLKDRPCNISISLRADQGTLDMMVTCRSNDLVFGALGANVVHMSILQEYLAARIGIPEGTYTQVSFNLHLYEWAMDKCDKESAWSSWRGKSYPGHQPLVDDPESFDDELHHFMNEPNLCVYKNTFFSGVAEPMMLANNWRREKRYDLALEEINKITAPDWGLACRDWLRRRMK